jgi:hypothetical protein
VAVVDWIVSQPWSNQQVAETTVKMLCHVMLRKQHCCAHSVRNVSTELCSSVAWQAQKTCLLITVCALGRQL